MKNKQLNVNKKTIIRSNHLFSDFLLLNNKFIHYLTVIGHHITSVKIFKFIKIKNNKEKTIIKHQLYAK